MNRHSFNHILCFVLCLMSHQGCTQTVSPSSDAAAPKAIIWKLDNTKTVDGHASEVLGSPQVVSTSSGRAGHFNGASDGLIIPMNPIQGWKEFTIEVLLKPEAGGNEEQRFLHVQDSANSRGLLELRLYEKAWALDAFLFSEASQKALFDRTKLHPADRWTWVAMVYRDGKLTSYVDGMKELEGDVTFPPMGEGKISLGVRQNLISWFRGEIREVRFHPVALQAGELRK